MKSIREHDIKDNASAVSTLTPRQIVEHLDHYIVGQEKAKRAVAIALRNRWRRQQLPPEIAEEIIPKNILIIGPTGVGKTEIARRIARLTRSPFIKVEASKFTEVGYVGRDVESMVRDLVELAVNMVKSEHRETIREKAEIHAEERLLDILLPKPDFSEQCETEEELARREKSFERTREKIRMMLRNGELDDREVEISIKENFGGLIEVFSSSGIEEIGMHVKDMLPGFMSPRRKRKKLPVEDARKFLIEEEMDRLIDMDKVIRDAIQRVENQGIIFIDEIDKVAGREGGMGPDVSREGVQRDLLPIIEGSAVSTKYGIVHTNHILFIGAGAFSVSKPADLIPELQGRFPVKVDVHSLTREHMRRILSEPRNALTVQYQALLSTEGITVKFEDDALDSIAELAENVNSESEDIGARRLHTIMELMMSEISFNAPEMKETSVTITADYVRNTVSVEKIIKAENIRKKRKLGFR